MNKAELVQAIAERTRIAKKDVADVVDVMMDVIAETLARGDKVQLVGFGHFEIRERRARKGRNPQTGEEILIAASRVPAFRAGKLLREGVR
ncbi:transcriptional regulator [Alicyclobacillus cellulosilyticus]|uniref:Transcriptional regulator n=1 Tax=Alicyclobacillus cellulosilyticus TaxID=1003997 RepID=A0A917KGA8_9BACL|nr:HU family DNA-binding protein [Alicyclobacillus cellulosilyticus]GGJ10228.1 transcriptional regulator [Alicyclobacillus cellulosilyticus]